MHYNTSVHDTTGQDRTGQDIPFLCIRLYEANELEVCIASIELSAHCAYGCVV